MDWNSLWQQQELERDGDLLASNIFFVGTAIRIVSQIVSTFSGSARPLSGWPGF
jgi:hypothetical protein